MTWEGLSPPYSTIVADPPWHYPDRRDDRYKRAHLKLPYSGMDLGAIKALPVGDLGTDARLYLWTTNRYLRHAWDVIEAWGFTPQDRVLVWCKPPRCSTPVTTEFVVVGKRGKPAPMPWHGTTWFQWGHQGRHSAKPAAFLDLVEQWSPGPYVELFARSPRLGWDSWGYGYETGGSAMVDQAVR